MDTKLSSLFGLDENRDICGQAGVKRVQRIFAVTALYGVFPVNRILLLGLK